MFPDNSSDSPHGNSSGAYSIGAELIYTMLDPPHTKPLQGRFINVVDKRIESFTKRPTQDVVYDFGNDCIILPGTVNLHAHLELSQLPEPLDVPVDEKTGRRPMADWISKLMEFRRSGTYDARNAIHSALIRPEILTESVAIADIVPFDFLDGKIPKPKHPVWARFLELIAWTSDQAEKKLQDFRNGSGNGEFFGLSPHAPQTVCPELLEAVVGMKLPLAMHLAETPEEIEFLRTGGGPLFDLMRRADPDYDPRNVLLGGSKPTRPLDYLRFLSEAPKVFVIHGNYLDDEELKFLAEHRETMSVVYCPRSHAYFGHKNYPLRKMLDFGVNVLLGTDGLASTPDLSLVNEIEFALRQYPEIPPETLFRIGTISGAEALGLENDFGTLEEGKLARFSFLSGKFF